jgi:cytochrome c556
MHRYLITMALRNMKFVSFTLFISLLAGAWLGPAYAEPMVSLKKPPASLEQWYKPANKRQVWLHTMFRLRREMQAIAEYAEQNDQKAMDKWIKRLDKDYNKIAEMVPEWEKAVKPKLLSELEMFAEKGDMPRVGKTLKMIKRTCDDCHTYYAPLVTATYRSPYYDDIKLKDSNGDTSGDTSGKMQSFEENMEQLSDAVNRVLIALDDGHNTLALESGKLLAEKLQNLGESCSSCHKDDEYPRERILGKATQERFEKLQVNISAGRVKDSQKLMGEIAVTVCARCHNTHRIVSDLRNALLPED